MCPTCCMQKSSLLWVWSQFLSWIVCHVHGLSWGPGFRGKAARLIKRGWTGGGTGSRHSTIPVGSQTMEGVIGYEVLVAKHLLVFTSKLNSSPRNTLPGQWIKYTDILLWDCTDMWLSDSTHALETRYPLIWLLKGFYQRCIPSCSTEFRSSEAFCKGVVFNLQLSNLQEGRKNLLLSYSLYPLIIPTNPPHGHKEIIN